MIKVKLTYQHLNWPLLQQTSGSKGVWAIIIFMSMKLLINENQY
ncbi:MAG: hypothetical protein EMLJLAPB_00204 [Candidatus Argoarchaeum ethanivorans]|uniref:Uncharacterized protein n=1 Tax=Candidatus Argoarchaeum ethanivorans TaxID=2608793 RepID=A0A811T921_9EURY|nr:MAG: hypothetical protein EMLJLAPB_00204 [Candidatus Argoarchaeum ethanivorans]